ncbi:ribosome small subunit-dependent GTPase A [SAR86 cluster bacterium SAR86E]|jgi:ribosome biogenesis GTPase|uniref:Small ribosomal subunit biogenesis GTPase RsgA n=1 Tax=SAR86 cluster bacterium SAR86E TaxID=1208365 RepID=K6GIK0_9GAMM|nr:ribosome small subunit-dependent GTPase A [SAR86 cluster bacterium SAR86E]
MLKLQIGQIVEFYSNSCCVVSEGKEFKCKIQGRINLVVGDLVEIELSSVSNSSEGLVIKRLDRITALYKSKEKVKKPIAANISHIGILVTKNPKTNLEFIDKWITISKIASIEPFIIFNKIDLLPNGAFREDQKIYERLGIKTFQISAKLFINVDELKIYLSKRTTIFVGNSGSGKSTLTSAITGKEILSKALSNNQGVHTTSVSTLYHTDQMKIIDSPGVRDIGIDHLKPKEIILGFPEIINYSLNCAFPNCSHQADAGCEVMAALKNGDIEESRYNNFIFLSNREINE